MTRRPDWLARLHRFLEGRRTAPFAWGSNDCALFVCDAVLAMTGTDLAEMVRGKYSSEEEARAVLAKLTGGYLSEYAAQVARRHALQTVDWRHLRRGDVGLIENEFGGALGLVLPDGRTLGVMAEEAKGLRAFPVRTAKMGWLIG